MARRYEYLFTIRGVLPVREGSPVNLWTGEADLTIGGVTYTPTNIVESVTIAGGQLPNSETRITLRLFATTDELRTSFLQDPGPAQVVLRQVVSVDDGTTWTLVPRAFTGRVSGPELQGDRYSVDLVDRLGDPLRPRPRFWSDEDQQRRFTGDRGLQYMKRIATGVDVKWP